MDNIPIQLMQQLAMAALGSMAQPSNPGNMSGNPFAYHGMASIMPEEDSFFGPIGTLAATMVPGLSTTGLDGRPTPILKTNFRMKNSGMTGLQNMAMRQNAAAYAAARAENDAAAQAGWGKLFGEGSILPSPPSIRAQSFSYNLSHIFLFCISCTILLYHFCVFCRFADRFITHLAI